MNNSQLFKMYQRFEHKKEWSLVKVGKAGQWLKWHHLSEMTRRELEKRLDPEKQLPYSYAAEIKSLNDSIHYWEQFGLSPPD